MSINGISNLTSAFETADMKATKSASKSEGLQKSNVVAGEAAESGVVYEPNSEKKKDTTKVVYEKEKNTNSIEQLKAETKRRTGQLRDLVEKLLLKQGIKLQDSESIWGKLRKGEVDVDEETAKKATKEISEDGYWGVEQTSDRILSFAKALTNDDPSKAEEMKEAFKKGYEAATEAWGDKLPEISQRTYDAVMKKFDEWANGSEPNQPKPEENKI